MNQLTFLLEEPHANRFPSRDSVVEWMTSAETWPSNFCDWLIDFAPSGFFGRTSPECCHQGTGETLAPFSGAWSSAGMGSPTECWTLNFSDWLSDASVCSLSDILETGDLPARFYLSAKACAGILRRAEKRGKTLPPQLARALRAAAG